MDGQSMRLSANGWPYSVARHVHSDVVSVF